MERERGVGDGEEEEKDGGEGWNGGVQGLLRDCENVWACSLHGMGGLCGNASKRDETDGMGDRA